MTIPIVAGGGILTLNGSGIGNVIRFQFAPKFELAQYPDYSTGVKRIGETRVSFEGVTGSFVTDYITAANMALWLAVNKIDSLAFYSANPVEGGANPLYTFTDVMLMPGGETQLIIEAEGDTWQGLPFNFEGTLVMPDVAFLPSYDPPDPGLPPIPEDEDQFITLVAGMSLSGNHVVYVDEDGKAYYADRTDLDHREISGITTGAISENASGTIQTSGVMINALWNWTMDLTIFLSTNGLLTQTPPTSGFVLDMGFPLSSTSMFIRVGTPITLL